MPLATVSDPGGLLGFLAGSLAPEADGTFVERAEPRRDSNWIAVIVTPYGEEIPCSVRDVSKSGARVGVPDTMPLPETFVLKVLGKDVSCHVRVMWRRANQAGLRIERLSRTSLDAEDASPVPVTTAQATAPARGTVAPPRPEHGGGGNAQLGTRRASTVLQRYRLR